MINLPLKHLYTSWDDYIVSNLLIKYQQFIHVTSALHKPQN